MDYLPIVRCELDHLDSVFKSLETAVIRIPEIRLGEQPVPGGMGVGELVDHLVRGVQVTLLGVVRGAITEDEMAELPSMGNTLASSSALREYVREVRGEVQDLMIAVLPEMLERKISWFGVLVSGCEACMMAYQEALHHRGQVMTYLRLMGLEPVDVYAG